MHEKNKGGRPATSSAKVRRIERLLCAGKKSRRAIAREVGVSRPIVSLVAAGGHTHQR